MRERCLVVGLGNPILGDDGVGWCVAAEVEERLGRSARTVEVERAAVGGLGLMERLIGFDRAVIVDAVHTGRSPDGTVTTFDVDDLPDPSSGYSSSAHDTSLPNAMRVGRALGASLPRDVTIVAVEISSRYRFSEQLSQPVAAAVPRAAGAVVALLDTIQPQEEHHGIP